jgi:hypothetical protein
MKILGFNITRSKQAVSKTVKRGKPTKQLPVNDRKRKRDMALPPGRVSSPNKVYDGNLITEINKNLQIVKPDYTFNAIPLIRKLYKVNEDVGSVLYDSIQLTNTGHRIKFDQSVPAEMADKMRSHLEKVSKNWHAGSAGVDGLINKWIAQIYVSGALSVEWAPNKRLTGIDRNILVNPETIRAALDNNGNYEFYQKVDNFLKSDFRNQYIKLNKNTYMYFGLFGDEDTPYGIPPFLTALKSLSTQKDMKDNMEWIMQQMGLLGYLEVLIAKPDQNANEDEGQYTSRLSSLLEQTKKNMINGFKEGIVTGYQDDHDFEFHSTTKNLNGVSDLFNLNQKQIANGLKTSPSFLGVSSGNTESFLSIVFTKTLSQLKNVQQILATALQKGYELELMMAGFDYKSLKVEFNASTVTDDMKLQQGKEVKQRVLRLLWIDGIISSEQYAEEMGYTKPYKKVKPPLPGADSGNGQVKKEKRESDKDKSDRKVRDKNKPQPKRKDQSTKER